MVITREKPVLIIPKNMLKRNQSILIATDNKTHTHTQAIVIAGLRATPHRAEGNEIRLQLDLRWLPCSKALELASRWAGESNFMRWVRRIVPCLSIINSHFFSEEIHRILSAESNREIGDNIF